ncbi:hypothetical protein [Acinetobacter chinensis]|uniref:hypothetical protein n=2 Tax=Acinetobacter chinensis TaxID=2004650 RepID=UPI00293424F1|nr:hypothetical protein [Acinetobacter chinensis]WOE42400.1 hypothetical protein QSG87_04470 [Acinetobacter chinensis]WOE42907.1 hypothetical protein QSG87_07240 [Acinetobacter chinensis]
MQRIDSVNVRPDVNGAGKPGFHDNADLSGQDATYLTPTWLNTVQEEICNLIEKNGYTLNVASRQQLYDIIATNDSVTALAEAMENRLVQLQAVLATKSALEQGISYVMSELGQHKTASNPHPQYLLASTFGVHIPMTAAIGRTEIKDENRVLGWNGQSSDWTANTGEITWGGSLSGSVEFTPYRAYGQFLLSGYISTATFFDVNVRVFNAEGIETSLIKVTEYGGSYASYGMNKVFEIPKGGKAVIEYRVDAGYSKRAQMTFSVYVDDRVKVFTPVGLTSVVDATDFTESTQNDVKSDYSSFPAFEWFYGDTNGQYFELSAISNMSDPVNKIPHYHRDKFTQLEKDLYIAVQAGKQTIESPSDYAVIDTQILRARTDAEGNVVVAVPLSMRSITTANNETLVYTFVYYLNEPDVTGALPVGLDGEHKIYVRL